MSTFDGIVQEFPCIQIDYFRKPPDHPPPLACFLSHVHSDHLQGLESFRAPFIYCSAATRELLLHIEKYPHHTPTEIELTPRLKIRVTLLDANHCTGAVMFLIEGEGKAILYTGDIRAEPWWVNGLVRHPILLPYTLGSRRLDKIYLDTTFACSSFIYRTFPSKGEGVAELLQKIASYPSDTVFYFRAWTFGYESIHVDRYQLNLYRSLKDSHTPEAPGLYGFSLGNCFVSGCLSDDEQSRIHSCEPGVQCSAIPSRNPVYIIPIVNRMQDGSQISEAGAGGGGGDLYQIHELELPDETALSHLEQLCLERIHDSDVLSQTRQRLVEAFRSKNRALSLDMYGVKEEDNIPLDRLHFPYSRHSSYAELCQLVGAFKPRDIFPCTVDPITWCEDVSMQSLFGHLCSGRQFVHDNHMRDMIAGDEELRARKRARIEFDASQRSTQLTSSIMDIGSDQSLQELNGHHSQSNSAPPDQLDVCFSSSERIPIPSSLEAIKETNHETLQINVNEPIIVPKSGQETERAKRAEVRQAWHFLNSARSEQKNLQHGELPSSWSEDSAGISKSIPSHLGHENEDQNEHNEEDDIGADTETEPDPDSTTQPSQPLSIPSSAFESQEYRANDGPPLSFETIPDNENTEPLPSSLLVGSDDITSKPSCWNNDARPSLKRASSSRTRRAAYLAARADSYEAWASMSLVSAGNNHTEEEVEL
ncbi:hypothetical protein FE257_002789 [Aspergillus nanangensis]|uniref:Protein artemis n=1 Tax=Aspergillus nanangensis TaxID=2582783 RepID=A0AAD4CC98_ASPNN|nr:hypothetical protein FE257_002789 [Aspergillus nanangensis]